MQTAELVGWAPTAVFCSILGAGLTSIVAMWLVLLYDEDFSSDAARILTIGIAAVTIVGLLIWFAAMPRASATIRRFWLLVRLEIVLMGIIGFWVAINEVVNLFVA